MTLGLKAAGIITLVAGALIAFLYWQNHQMQEKIDVMNQSIGSLETTATTLEARLNTERVEREKLNKFSQENKKSVDRVNNEVLRLAEESRRLSKLFSEHDLGALAEAKPGLIENRVNKGTKEVLKEFEEATKPLSPEEAQKYE